MTDDLSVDDIVWLAGQFSRPPLSPQALANLRERLSTERRGPGSVVEDRAEVGEQVGARTADGP